MKEEIYIDTVSSKALEKCILYYDNGNIESELYYNINSQLHRENGPAIIRYYKDGSIYSECYYLNGKIHRDNGPASIYYYKIRSTKNEINYLNDIECDILQEMVIRGLMMEK